MKNIITTTPPINPIVIGRIGKAYGVQGWIKIISFTDKIDNIFCYQPWLILFKMKWKLIRLEYWKLIKKHYIAKIFGISNREVAMLLTNSNLLIEASQLPSLYNNEYYWKDIIGCTVITVQGNNLGYIDNIMETIAYDILVVKIFQNNSIKTKKFFIPFIQDKIIKNIDLIKNVIIVNWEL